MSSDHAISSSLELDASFREITGGFLEGRGEVLLEMIGLDENLHAKLEEGQRCGRGMEFCGGAEVSRGHRDA